MKKRSFLILAACFTLNSFIYAQVVSHSVHFDTYLSPSNNDLVNNFSNTSWISAVTSGGITGGALQPPDSISWGNDLIAYCRNYLNVTDTLTETSVCFKYNASLVRSSAYQRAADIWLFSDVINHWLIFSVNYNQHLTVLSYGSATDSMAALVTGHWYRLAASCRKLSLAPGDWMYARAEVFDLGTGGTASPVSVGSNTSVFQDSDMAHSAYYDVKVSGARFGGGELLDDFSYLGITGSNSCSLAGIENVPANKATFSAYPQPSGDFLTLASETMPAGRYMVWKLYDATGRLLLRQEKVRLPVTVSLAGLADGFYIIELDNGREIYRKEIVKQD